MRVSNSLIQTIETERSTSPVVKLAKSVSVLATIFITGSSRVARVSTEYEDMKTLPAEIVKLNAASSRALADVTLAGSISKVSDRSTNISMVVP